MIWFKDKPCAAVQIQRKLPCPLAPQWMRLAGDEFGHAGSGLQIVKTSTEFTGTGFTEFPLGMGLVLA
ncbi:MAG: hypothetical protein WD572_00790 [Gammaproteobacteria bacterium]